MKTFYTVNSHSENTVLKLYSYHHHKYTILQQMQENTKSMQEILYVCPSTIFYSLQCQCTDRKTLPGPPCLQRLLWSAMSVSELRLRSAM